MKCPCQECEKRYIGCHGNCSDYKEWAIENDNIRRMRQKAQQNSNIYLIHEKPVRKRK